MAIRVVANKVYLPPGTPGSVAAVRAQSNAFARAPAVSAFTGCLNKASGVGTRNGTTIHCIGGAQSPGCELWFTPTVGTLLVAFIAGGVTHTSVGTGTGSGWTERQSPVASSELSLFTKTAAGNDYLELSHNGTNYPIAWAMYEFTVGSTYINSSAATASNDTFPALAGLPATPKFILAAFCRGVSNTNTTSGSATVPAPWVEDVDSFTTTIVNGTGGGGIFFHVSYQEDFTGTTITPVITPTFNNTGVTADRQKIVAALTLAT